MNREELDRKIAKRLDELEALELEERIAPVKCDKDPDAPECNPDPVVRYGIVLDE